MKKINIAIQVGSSEEIEGVLTYCAEHGVRSYSLRALVYALGLAFVRLAKRLADIAFSLLMLLTLFPVVYVVMAIIIKRHSPGPAIVVEAEEESDGRERSLYAFRLPEAERRSIIARSPRLLNILMGQLSLFS